MTLVLLAKTNERAIICTDGRKTREPAPGLVEVVGENCIKGIQLGPIGAFAAAGGATLCEWTLEQLNLKRRFATDFPALVDLITNEIKSAASDLPSHATASHRKLEGIFIGYDASQARVRCIDFSHDAPRGLIASENTEYDFYFRALGPEEIVGRECINRIKAAMVGQGLAFDIQLMQHVMREAVGWAATVDPTVNDRIAFYYVTRT